MFWCWGFCSCKRLGVVLPASPALHNYFSSHFHNNLKLSLLKENTQPCQQLLTMQLFSHLCFEPFVNITFVNSSQLYPYKDSFHTIQTMALSVLLKQKYNYSGNEAADLSRAWITCLLTSTHRTAYAWRWALLTYVISIPVWTLLLSFF